MPQNALIFEEYREVPIEHHWRGSPLRGRRALAETGRGTYVPGQSRVPSLVTLTSKGQPYPTSSGIHQLGQIQGLPCKIWSSGCHEAISCNEVDTGIWQLTLQQLMVGKRWHEDTISVHTKQALLLRVHFVRSVHTIIFLECSIGQPHVSILAV